MEISLPIAINDYKGDTIAVDNDMISIRLELRKQSFEQLELKEVDASSKKNGVDVFLEPNGIKVNDHIFDFTHITAIIFTTFWLSRKSDQEST